jgi:RNA polymerase sigma factor (sigma-70 family)
MCTGAASMPNRRTPTVLPYLRKLAARLDDAASDRELLRRFQAERDEGAFAEIVRRHQPMLLRVCRRVLSDGHDAEDVCQAAFLVLAKRASAVRWHDSVAGWLYRAARRLALKLQRADCRRRRYEARAQHRPPADEPPAALAARELQGVLDSELGRLPEKYRAPILLCCLEGRTRDEAARFLGWPLAAVKNRLEQGRARLRRRLARRGVTLGAALTSAWLTEGPALARCAPAATRTARFALSVRSGQAKVSAMVPARVARLAEGVARTMFLTQLKVAAAALALVAGGIAAWNGFASRSPEPEKSAALQPDEPPRSDPDPSNASTPEAANRRATRLALRAHAAAAAIDKLPRFSYRVRTRGGIIDSMRAIDPTLELFQKGLAAPDFEADQIGWYETSFSWDEERFLREMKLAPSRETYWFWTRGERWQRHDWDDGSPRQFVHGSGPTFSWKNMSLFEYAYLRLTPHRFWWGQMVHDQHQNMCPSPPESTNWRYVKEEAVGTDRCDVVEAPECAQRLWISRASGRVRRVASYLPRWSDAEMRESRKRLPADESIRRIAGKEFSSSWDYQKWYQDEATEDQLQQVRLVARGFRSLQFPADYDLNELAEFDDYREVAPGVWMPFREVRVFPHASETKGKRLLRRSELMVREIRTDVSLVERYAQLLPKEGDRVQDQRFGFPVNLDHRAERTDAEFRAMAAEKQEELQKAQEKTKELLQPLEDMVGKPAPPLPEEGWVGGRRPDVRGRAYLVHFWATGCGPCKMDMYNLKTLAGRGVIIVGMHPPGTAAEEVEKRVREQELGYPTFLEKEKKGDEQTPRIAGYPVVMFPYNAVVDEKGRIAGHGPLFELFTRFSDELVPPPQATEKDGDP